MAIEYEGVIRESLPPFDLDRHLDFELVAPGIAKMRGGDVYAHDAREAPCDVCGGRQDARFMAGVRRRKNPQDWELAKVNDCPACWGRGVVEAIQNYRRRRFGVRPFSTYRCATLADVRTRVQAESLLAGCRLHCFEVPPSELALFHGGTRDSLTIPDHPSDIKPGPCSTVERASNGRGRRMGAVVSLLNQKGGVGKTSSCHHVAGSLARAGHRVLLVDADPQASLTQGFWGPEVMRGIPAGESVAALFDAANQPIPEVLIKPTGIDGISIVPGSISVTPFNMIPTSEWGELEGGMRDFLNEARDEFTVTLIDCPPNLYLLSWAALVASDFVVVPLQAEDYGAQGLGPVQDSVAMVQAGPNPALKIAGYLLSMFDKRLGIHLAYESMLRQMYEGDVFTNPMPLAKDFKEAVATRLPVSHYKPRGVAGKAAAAVAAELVDRIAERSVAAEDRSAA